MITSELQTQALKMNPSDKIRLVEMLLESLDKPDPEIEAAWVAESERRYAVYKKGGEFSVRRWMR
jgi:putative addiction module component (TIGR02574 family)